ncbi:MAG: META domain-containing protein [Anaerolineales bacterium]
MITHTFVGVVTLMLAACAPAATPPAASSTDLPPVPANALAGTAWNLVSFGAPGAETPVVEGSTVTLEFQADGQATGSGGCNSYGGAYQAQDGALSFSAIASTKMACADEGMMQQEQRYFEALQSASGYELTGDQLAITYADGVLNFVRRAAGQLEARVPGIIDFHADGTRGVLTAPDRVQAGEDFEVTISTFGGGCQRAGDTAIVVTNIGAAVMVYDFTTATQPGVVCTAILKRLTHTITLNFTEPGEMLIQVWGRRVGQDTALMGVPIVLEHRVTVQ